MKGLNNTLRLWAEVFAIVLLSGCETTPPVAESPRAETAAIGIQLTTAGPLGPLSTQTPEQVFFVRLVGDSLVGDDVARSNFAKGGRVYLLNASPGTYVIVASSASVPSPFAYGSPGRETTFFSRELVELTRVEVRANELAFAGKFDVLMSTAFSGGDEVQIHYRKLITPSAPPGGLMQGMLQTLGGEKSAWGSLRASDNGTAARAAFMKAARADLAGQGWDARLAPPD